MATSIRQTLFSPRVPDQTELNSGTTATPKRHTARQSADFSLSLTFYDRDLAPYSVEGSTGATPLVPLETIFIHENYGSRPIRPPTRLAPEARNARSKVGRARSGNGAIFPPTRLSSQKPPPTSVMMRKLTGR